MYLCMCVCHFMYIKVPEVLRLVAHSVQCIFSPNNPPVSACSVGAGEPNAEGRVFVFVQ